MQKTMHSRFNESDFENGYSRNLLWRLWHASKALEMEYLSGLCAKGGSTYDVYSRGT